MHFAFVLLVAVCMYAIHLLLILLSCVKMRTVSPSEGALSVLWSSRAQAQGTIKTAFGSNTNFNKRNCHAEHHLCGTDRDCDDICDNVQRPIYNNLVKCNYRFVCDEKYSHCVPFQLKSESEPTFISDAKSDGGGVNKDVTACNIENGCIRALSIDMDIFRGKPSWININIAPQYFDNQHKLHAYICHGGEVQSVNWDDTKMPIKCSCPPDWITVAHVKTPTVPICMKRSNVRLLSSYKELVGEQRHKFQTNGTK